MELLSQGCVAIHIPVDTDATEREYWLKHNITARGEAVAVKYEQAIDLMVILAEK